MVKINDLFSPEQLRCNWKVANKGEPTVVNNKSESIGWKQILAGLSVLIEQQFSGDDLLVLNLFISDLECLLEEKLPEKQLISSRGVEMADLDVKINLLINQVEDLLEAFEINNRCKGIKS